MKGSAATLLEDLRRSIVFEPSFPKRPFYTHAELQDLPQKEQLAIHSPGIEAIKKAGAESDRLIAIVNQLGLEQYQPAVETLVLIWQECALLPLRNAAGRALFHMKSDAARQGLQSMILDQDHFSVFLGVRAVFDNAPDAAYEYFAPLFQQETINSQVIAGTALNMLAPNSFTYKNNSEVPSWSEPRAPQWLRQDPRWLELCSRLRKDPHWGYTARAVLRYADPAARDLALRHARATEDPSTKIPKVTPLGDLLSRYNAGERESVWSQISLLGPIDGQLRQEVFAVARSTMQRVKQNVELISCRLKAAGWLSLGGELHTQPLPGDGRFVRAIENITGEKLPLTLLSFWTVVGGVDWVWDYNAKKEAPNFGLDIPLDEMDPLCIDAPATVEWQFEEWTEQTKQPDPDLVDPFFLSLAPDDLHKANISGGPPYGVNLPTTDIDPIFANEAHLLPFLDYLRLSFAWAGFPGLELHSSEKGVKEFIKKMSADLQPF